MKDDTVDEAFELAQQIKAEEEEKTDFFDNLTDEQLCELIDNSERGNYKKINAAKYENYKLIISRVEAIYRSHPRALKRKYAALDGHSPHILVQLDISGVSVFSGASLAAFRDIINACDEVFTVIIPDTQTIGLTFAVRDIYDE